MTTKRLFRVDPWRFSGIMALLAIVGSALWLPATLWWRGKVANSAGYQAMREQFADIPAMWMDVPTWLIVISPITNGGLVFVTTLITVALFNWFLRRLGGLKIEVEDGPTEG